MSKRRNYTAVPLIPFWLNDISDFLKREHPTYNIVFEKHLYDQYWKDQIEKCIKGVWGHDYDKVKKLGGYRWCPGNLYFYVNMTSIKVEGEEGREVVSNPFLRDIEWLVFYALTECDGFSGFEGDDQFTSYVPVGKLQGKIKNSKGKVDDKLTNQEKKDLERFKQYVTKADGSYKTYIEPKEALYKTYDQPMGRALYYNDMKNLVILSTRGAGKSYIASNGVILYDFVFGSSRTLEDFLKRRNPSVSVVGAVDSTKSKELLDKFTDAYEYLRKSIGAIPDEGINSPFYQPVTGSLRNSGDSLSNMVLEEGGGAYTGTGSRVVHISYKDKPTAGVGFRARRMIVEEVGLADKFEEIHAANSASQRRETKTGYTVYIGTGGDVKKVKGVREAFYGPNGYECVAFDDHYTGGNKKGQIGLFIPAYYRKITYKDKNGNTNYEEAFEDEMSFREKVKAEGSKAYEGHIIGYPIVPSEMFLQASGNLFPTDLLENRITDLETGEWEKLAKTGELYYTDKENRRCVWSPLALSESGVIKRWGDEKGMSDEQLKGCIVVYEHPVHYKPELTHFKYMYLVTYDGVRDEDGGTSLACVQVWKMWDMIDTNSVQCNLVAEWLGRHIGTEGLIKDHEVAFKLATYYGCPIFPEINVKDILRHGTMTNRYSYFLPRPRLALEGMKVVQKKKYDVGLYISPTMKPDLETYLNELLHVVTTKEHYIIGDDEITKEVKVVDRIPSLRLAEELLYYSRENNFDAVSSGMLFAVAKRQREAQPQDEEEDEDTAAKETEFLKFMERSERMKSRSGHPAFSY